MLNKSPFILISGPCVIENREITFEIAKELKRITSELKIPFIFKASYDKANRTSIDSFRGLGIKCGLRILKEVKETFDILVMTDVHCINDIDEVAKVVDIIQIPAFLCRQTDLLIKAGMTGKIINIKKGQFLAPSEIEHIVKKIEITGNKQILITERGTTFGYNNLINDFRGIPIMKKFGHKVIFDATHSVQQPGLLKNKSGGQREFIPLLAKCGIVAGCDGLFIEVHPNPDNAKSDGLNSLPLQEVEKLLRELIPIREVL